jgi:hypothetical protein
MEEEGGLCIYFFLLLTDLRTFTGGTCCWEFWARGPGNYKET